MNQFSHSQLRLTTCRLPQNLITAQLHKHELQIGQYNTFQFDTMSEPKTPSRKKQHKQQAHISYCFKPRTVRNTPLNRYDLSELLSTDANGSELTDYFNYGFNSETFPVYAKLCKRFAEAEELEHPNATYDSSVNNQFKFNDDTPIDFGGFGPFLDKELIDIWENDNFQNGDSLMDFFVRFNMLILAKQKSNQIPYYLVQFTRLMCQQGSNNHLAKIIDEIAGRINDKYQKTMKVLKKKEEGPAAWKKKQDCEQLSTLGEQARQCNFYDDLISHKNEPTNKGNQKKNAEVKIEAKKQAYVKHESKDQSSKSIVYSSMEDSGEEDNDVKQEEVEKPEMKCNSEPIDQWKNKDGHHQRSGNSREGRNEKEDERKKQEHRLKREKGEDRERSHHKKKKKEKSKKIKKHKSHKKHKKHGKKSKKHKH